MDFPLNTLGLAHRFLSAHIRPGAFCVDATAGKGRDTVFLAKLAGPQGRVLAMDIQPQAVEATKALIQTEGVADRVEVVLDSHSNLSRYASPGTADAVVFNFGWLPGGSHQIFTRVQTSIPAITQGLELLKPDGVMSLCIYYGRDCGYEERDALLEFLETIDDRRFTVLVSRFANRPNDPPIPVFIWGPQAKAGGKEGLPLL